MASIFHRIAGVSGAVAIALGAYGSHGGSKGLFVAAVFVKQWKITKKDNVMVWANYMFLCNSIAGLYFEASSLNQDDVKKFKESFMAGNLYHHLSNLALLAVPFAKRPNLVGSLICGGVLLFSGSCYLVGLKQDKSFGKLAPVGGYLLMAGWLAFAF